MSISPVDLWRSVHTDEFPDGPIVDNKPVEGILYPTFSRKQIGTLPNGKPKFRNPDVVIVDGLVQVGVAHRCSIKEAYSKGRHGVLFISPKVP